MKAFTLTTSYKFDNGKETVSGKNILSGIYTTLRSAQKAMAEEIFTHLENHPWDVYTCDASLPFEEYDFHGMRNMFEDDPEFNFDAKTAILSCGPNVDEFVKYEIEEREILGPVEKPKWDFEYDEEVFDSAGRNFIGSLSDGGKRLFYHAFVVNEEDRIETCFIFNTLVGMMQHDEDAIECSYPWTSENDSKVIDALNNIKDDECYNGENGVLHSIKFDTDIETMPGGLRAIYEKILQNRHKRLNQE